MDAGMDSLSGVSLVSMLNREPGLVRKKKGLQFFFLKVEQGGHFVLIFGLN